MKTAKFTTTILQMGNNTGIEVPEEIITQFGAGKKPAVVVELKDYTYKSTVGVIGGKYLIPLSSEHRKKSTVAGGDTLEVHLTLDELPRTVDIPIALQQHFDKSPLAKTAFEQYPPSGKKKIADLVLSAKTEETKTKRLLKIIASLESGEKI